MKDNLQLEVQKSLNKIRNLDKQQSEMIGKISTLLKCLNVTQDSLKKELDRIESLGIKAFSRNPEKPDSEESLQRKEEFNQLLKKEKEFYISQQAEGELYSSINGCQTPAMKKLKEELKDFFSK